LQLRDSLFGAAMESATVYLAHKNLQANTMAKQIAENLIQVTEAIRKYSAGVTTEELLVDPIIISLKPSRRTLQRWLAQLIEKKILLREGSSVTTKYRVVEKPTAPIKPEEQNDSYIPLSPEAEQIRRYIRQPTQLRTPVGYKRAFLDAYRPNETPYLSPALQQKLRELGRSPEADRPAGTYARQILNRLLIDLSWNSSRLEGNTYSRLDTERLIAEGQIAEGKAASETQMILNHKSAIEALVSGAEYIDFNRLTILNLHALLSDNLLSNQDAGGRLREIWVGITHTVYEPLSIPQVIDECFQQVLDTAKAIKNPFEQSFFVMVHLPYLQPFEDVNKQVSRLAANIPLIKHNFCPLSFTEVPERSYIDGILGVYELNQVELLRDVFVWAYERSCARYVAIRQSIGEPNPLRLRYRSQLSEAVAHIVKNNLDPSSSQSLIQQFVEDNIPLIDQSPVAQMISKELASLHEGNIFRHHLRPSEFETWHEQWRKSL
jgi:hypothetical protein